MIGVGEIAGGFIAPTIEGYAADRFGPQAPFLIASGAAVIATLLSFALKETAPGQARRADVPAASAGATSS